MSDAILITARESVHGDVKGTVQDYQVLPLSSRNIESHGTDSVSQTQTGKMIFSHYTDHLHASNKLAIIFARIIFTAQLARSVN